MTHYALRKIDLAANLAEVERQALISLLQQTTEVAAGEALATEGERPGFSTVMLEGLSYRSKVLNDGSRQIMAFHIAGDWVDLHSYFLRTMDHSVTAMSRCRIVQIPHRKVRQLIEGYPRLGAYLWRETMIDSAIFREWLVNLGARDAHSRMAHLLCELHTRLDAVGLAADKAVELPITQTDFADAMGVSTVHVNRVLQQLKQEGLVSYSRGSIAIHDLDALKAVAGFDPAYLHLTEGLPVAPITIVA